MLRDLLQALGNTGTENWLALPSFTKEEEGKGHESNTNSAVDTKI